MRTRAADPARPSPAGGRAGGDGDLAVVWASYAFHVDGKPSHAGVDGSHRIRTDEGWRISGGAYSMIRAPAAAGD